MWTLVFEPVFERRFLKCWSSLSYLPYLSILCLYFMKSHDIGYEMGQIGYKTDKHCYTSKRHIAKEKEKIGICNISP